MDFFQIPEPEPVLQLQWFEKKLKPATPEEIEELSHWHAEFKPDGSYRLWRDPPPEKPASL